MMKSGRIIVKKFLCQDASILDDSYISVGVSPARSKEEITGIGFSLHDGEHAVSFAWPIGNRSDLQLLQDMLKEIGSALGLLMSVAEGLVQADEAPDDTDQ